MNAFFAAGFRDTPSRGRLLRFFLLFSALAAFAFPPTSAQSQATDNLHNIRTVFVSPSGTGDTSEAIRKRLIDRLKKSGVIRVVGDAHSADAVLRSNTVIWPTGTVAPNPRSRSVVLTNYQGYLTAELASSSNRVLWSYLVTPSRFRMSNIVDDLADNLSVRLVEALKAGISDTATVPVAKSGSGISVRAAGATFPAPLYQKWFESFAEDSGGFPISYDAVGSVAGLAQLAAGQVDMAASDIPQSRNLPSQAAGLRYFRAVVGGVVPIYNLPEAGRSLNFTPQLLADIYAGKIRKWNDPEIRRWNSGAQLPDAEISVVHRSDGSGTTYVWTSFLAASSAEWKGRVGATIEWPIGTGVSGNEGVVERVAKTPGSIGYVELIYAIQHQLTYAAVQNATGRFVRADLDSITAAAADARSGTQQLLFSTFDAKAKNGYPITTFTWLVVPEMNSNARQRAAVSRFLRWMLTTGQKQCSALGYAPLPRDVATEELRQVDALK